AVALAAAQIHVAQELHLDVLEAVAVASRAAAVAGVEAERACRIPTLARERLRREELADRLERADEARGIRAGRLADRRLIDERDVVDRVRADDAAMPARLLGRAALELREASIPPVLDERPPSGAADAGDANEPAERNPHIDVLQVVLRGTLDDEPVVILADWSARAFRADAPLAAQVFGRQRRAVADELLRRAFEHDASAVPSGAG